MTAAGDDLRDSLVLALGNPLLDVIAVADQSFLEKYDMLPNNAILAEEKHKTICDEMVKQFSVEYVAGGASQNTSRGIQWIIGIPHVVVYMGCIGKDHYGQILNEKACEAGVNPRFMVHDTVPTGTCAVVITDQNRSLCADLGAANCFNISHIRKPENWKYVEQASYYYLTSFFLTVSPDTMLEVARHASERSKPVAMNLSAPFLVQIFSEPMMQLLPYVDIIFGNEDEAGEFAKKHSLGTSDPKEIAMKMVDFPKANNSLGRVIIVTQGPGSVIVAEKGSVSEYKVEPLSDDRIVDTNGAGDAFAGGFMAMYIQKKPLKVCVECGIYTAREVIQKSGCTFSGKPAFHEYQQARKD